MTELNSKEKDALARLFEFEEYKALKKLMENERFEIATKLLLHPSNDSIGIARQQGRAEALKNLHKQLQAIHADSIKKS